MITLHRKNILPASAALLLSLCGSSPTLLGGPNTFQQINLVSDLPGVAATTDADLVNPWGMSFSPTTSPIWVSDNGTGKATLYNGLGVKQGLVVSMPAGSAPLTGQVFAGGSGGFNGDTFLFATETGTITGWRGALGTTAELLSTTPDGVFKGLALGITGGSAYAYAADFHNGDIAVLKGTGAAPTLAGNFVDPNLPDGFAPFNIQNLGNKLYVSYALADATGHEDVAGAGNGFVSVYDLNGNFLQRLITGGPLNSPWGMAIAPVGFGQFGGALLVGNFGDGLINAFDATSGAFIDSLRDTGGNPIEIEGLWGLAFGNNGVGSTPSTLFFTAGISDGIGGEIEEHGLYGKLSHVPDSGTSAFLLAGGLLGVFAVGRRRNKALGLPART